MYIFINEDANMSQGKVGAQAAHAAVEAYRISDKELLDAWYVGGHYTKLVMSAKDAQHLLTIERYLNERYFKTALIIDEGRTEIAPHTPTALGVAVVDRDDEHTAATFGDFKTLRPKKCPPCKKKHVWGQK